MKKSIFAIVFVFASLFTFAQTDQYTQAMKSGLEKFGSAKTADDYKQAANQFERISGAMPDQWLPLYYNSFCHIQISFAEKDIPAKEKNIEIANDLLDKALLIKEKESEIYILKALACYSYISIDPMTRGAEYIVKANGYLEKAKSINPENPRVYHMIGQSLMNTPDFYGGGKEKAKPVLVQAQDKFNTFKPENDLMPNWGKNSNDQLLESCK
jgi:tetratricopeptide (TPR) repeat protein